MAMKEAMLDQTLQSLKVRFEQAVVLEEVMMRPLWPQEAYERRSYGPEMVVVVVVVVDGDF
jgi:hypothetical protein